MSTKSTIRDAVTRYYTGRLLEYGPTSQGVDWKSSESQELRFEQLLRVCEDMQGFSINDYGCGYGALYAYLSTRASEFDYTGIDWSEAMLAEASRLYGHNRNCRFSTDDGVIESADYTVASGIFNVKLDEPEAEWKQYVIETLREIDRISSRGFAFNALTSYADADRRESRLHYANPCELFDYCKRKFSKNVALLHDYGLFEFTIIVRK